MLTMAPRPASTDEIEPIQIVLVSDRNATDLRQLSAQQIGHLVKIPGIVISASRVSAKATSISITCRNCGNTKRMIVKPGLAGAALPRRCDSNEQNDVPQAQPCPSNPYVIVADKSKFIDQQTVKLQERQEAIPTGELPRHVLITMDRSLVGRVVPGSRVTIVGMYSTIQAGRGRGGGGGPATRLPYVRAVGIEVDADGAGRASDQFPPDEEADFQRMSQEGDVYEKLASNIAPAIFGSEDIKKAITCLLFGGSRKILPDGMRIRGDINVLLLGDPGTAKSQFLKFVEKIAPIGVYTSGKGSSAAGLTASVIRDPSTREFYLEGGAMCVADGGVVCIDEFDKMREEDRVAIHEAMEQQTISVAKAGITTILNSRTSVLAAANPVFGTYDDMRTPTDNIDFQATILSRFDLIFIVRDTHDTERDQGIAKHVIGLHMNSGVEHIENEVDLQLLKKYIHYCRLKCAPRLSEAAAQALAGQYVNIRRDAAAVKKDAPDQATPIPITVRQLEAIVRISESLAKMTMSNEATEAHVNEAVRLFKGSTMQAANAGIVGASESGLPTELAAEVDKVERHIKATTHIGDSPRVATLIDTAKNMTKVGDFAIRKAIQSMVQRGDLQYKQMRKVVQRMK